MVFRLFLVTVFFTTFTLSVSFGQARSYAVVVMDSQTGKILHEVNSQKGVYPASLTKMMTLYLAFEQLKAGKLKLDDRVIISRNAAAQPPSKLDIRAGESLSVKQAILALVTKSANNIAVALAEKLARTEQKCAEKMSHKASLLGLKNTYFRNASGFFHPQQKTTAYDMALLGRALLKNFPKEYQYFSTQNFSFRGKTYRNHNHLLGKIPGVDGIKTGFIEKSGFNLIASVKRKSRRFIVVVMGAKTRQGRDNHVAEIIEQAYINPKSLIALTNKIEPQAVMVNRFPKTTPCLKTPEESCPNIDALLTLAETHGRF